MYLLIYFSFVVAVGQLIVALEFFSNVIDGIKLETVKKERVVEV